MRQVYTAATRADPAFPWLQAGERFDFPPPEAWGTEWVVGVGGNLSPGMLLSAYSQGIFPWFGEHDPIIWQSPDPRFVLFPQELHCAASMRKVIRQGRFQLTIDTAFEKVIGACAAQKRPGQRGTWITPDMVEAYIALHELGWAHSVEAWRDGDLAGGFYGLALGRVFCGESMFHVASDAAKAAFIPFVWRLADQGFALVDSQARTEYMESLGARDIPRQEYLAVLSSSQQGSSLPLGKWTEALPGFPDSTAYRALMAARKA